MAEEQPKIEEQPKVPETPKVTHTQVVIVSLSDGRRGAFMGPMLVSKGELMLKPPMITDVTICEPRVIEEPKPAEEAPNDGNAEANQKGA